MINHGYTEIKATEISGNPFSMIDKEWFLLTAGSIGGYNTMTASWGAFGILWNKPVVFVFVRPQRYTYRFMESSDVFTLNFLGGEHRQTLNFCGKYSGITRNKVLETGLIPAETPSGAICFTQAKLILQCRKIYFDDLNPEHFLVNAIGKNYPANDYHRMYIGEIECCFQKNQLKET